MSEFAPAQLRAGLNESVSAVTDREWDLGVWERLSAYCTELAVWNQRINLTAARTPGDVRRQVEECLPLLPHLPGPSEVPARVVDVGAGGGLPGLVLAAFRPELSWVLVEPIRKKHAFLRAAARAMELRVDCRAVRDDVLEDASFDAALTRATWPMPEWLVRGRRLVRDGGVVLGLEGRERAELPAGVERFSYRVAGRERVAVVLRC